MEEYCNSIVAKGEFISNKLQYYKLVLYFFQITAYMILIILAFTRDQLNYLQLTNATQNMSLYKEIMANIVQIKRNTNFKETSSLY